MNLTRFRGAFPNQATQPRHLALAPEELRPLQSPHLPGGQSLGSQSLGIMHLNVPRASTSRDCCNEGQPLTCLELVRTGARISNKRQWGSSRRFGFVWGGIGVNGPSATSPRVGTRRKRECSGAAVGNSEGGGPLSGIVSEPNKAQRQPIPLGRRPRSQDSGKDQHDSDARNEHQRSARRFHGAL